MSTSILSIYSLAIVAIFATGCSTIHAAQHPPMPSSQSSLSHYFEKSTPESRAAFRITSDIQAKSSQSKQLSLAQINILNTHVTDPNMLVRVMVMSALMNAGPAHASAATAVARKGLVAIDGVTRLWALRDLDRLNAPDIIPVAKNMLTDHSHSVVDEARTILRKRGAGQ